MTTGRDARPQPAETAPAQPRGARGAVSDAVGHATEPTTGRTTRRTYEGVVDQYTRPIFTYLLRLTGERHHAEDLTQDVFLRLYLEWERIREDTVSAWLYRVARNLATDLFRKKRATAFGRLGTSHPAGDASPSEWITDSATDNAPHGAVVRAELQALVEQAIDELSPKLRDVFILCDIERLSYAEAADVLGTAEKTVSSRLARARERFNKRIAPYFDRH